MNKPTALPFIKLLAVITIDDVPLVGGKNASLGKWGQRGHALRLSCRAADQPAERAAKSAPEAFS